ncbi:odorant receptor 13a-like [Apis florea]|uniref:odorant receptor 13a-like n=1 Tax=Apis florea TaxID=7463 RepID=UPI00062953E7|nr:odorant receptor 13a-like [Apis florea]
MGFLNTDDISMIMTATFMKLVGLWTAKDRHEQRARKFALIYTLATILFALWIEFTDFYYSFGDFSTCLFNVCNIMYITMPLLKIFIIVSNKKDFFYLIFYTQNNFYKDNYNNKREQQIFTNCRRQCTIFVCFLTFSTKGTLVCYIISPLVENIGKNESERVLPFNMWVNLPLSTSPYYEIVFTIQALSLYHVGIGYFCFDNLLCVFNLQLAGQFQILQYKMANIADLIEEKNEKGIVSSPRFAKKCYAAFKNYVREHQALIAFCEKLEKVFSLIILWQVLMFSLIICLDGYQILLPESPVRRRLIFAFHLAACMCQLLMFTYSCDCIIQESSSIASAVYDGPWPFLFETTSGRTMRKDLTLVILRSAVPCCLTARGFFVVSLETYTRVLSTAVSYFTLLRQSTLEIV